MNVICCSVIIDGVLILLAGGGDTSTLHFLIELVWTFCTEKWCDPKPSLDCSRTPRVYILMQCEKVIICDLVFRGLTYAQ